MMRSLGRRWKGILLGVIATALGVSAVSDVSGVYWSRAEVVFLAPSSAAYPNSLMTTSSDIVMTAGAVALQVNNHEEIPKLADPDATLFDRGVRDGALVQLPDTGGQWAHHYQQQHLQVEVVGPTVEAVKARQAELIDEIERTLDDLQDGQGVLQVNRLTTDTVLPTPPVDYVTGERRRALVITAILGAAATAILAKIDGTLSRMWVSRRTSPARAGHAEVVRRRARTSA